jgi:hypothetical protein
MRDMKENSNPVSAAKLLNPVSVLGDVLKSLYWILYVCGSSTRTKAIYSCHAVLLLEQSSVTLTFNVCCVSSAEFVIGHSSRPSNLSPDTVTITI